MKMENTPLPGVLIITPQPRHDSRGYFVETYRKDKLDSIGIYDDFVQHNETMSLAKGTVRGFHFQIPGYNRLVRVTRGYIFFVALDLRKKLSTCGKYYSRMISAADLEQIYVPSGVAWAFMALSDETQMQYISSKTYNAAADRTIRFDGCPVMWPDIEPILSDRDAAGMTLDEWLASPEAKDL